MIRRALPSRIEALWLLVCAAILAWNLLLPGFIGMADNGDFAKVAGLLSLGSERQQGSMPHAVYLRDSRYYYNAHVPSSEILPAWAASTIEQTFGDPTRFDIRWLGAIHGLIFLAFYYSLLILLRPLSVVTRCTLALVALWIFADIALVAYLNSFYSDVPAALCGLAAIFLGARLLACDRPALSTIVLFSLAALGFITSKTQHGLLGFVPAGAAFLCGWTAPVKRTRVVGYLAGVVLTAATVWISGSTPDWYKPQALFNLIFAKLLKQSLAPGADLAELGLVPEDARYIGLNSFAPNGPMQDPAWRDRFGTRTSYSEVLKFYARHPQRALGILRSDLEEEAWQRLGPGISNLDGQSSGPRSSPAASLSSWSALRRWAGRAWPAHLPLWFAILLPGALVVALRRGTERWRRGLAWTAVAVGSMALVEFGVASLADACETARHLFIFQVFTDASVFLALSGAAAVLERACPASFRRPVAGAFAVGAVTFAAVLVKAEFAPSTLTLSSGMGNDTDRALVYSGVWRTGEFRPAFGGTVIYSDQTGATVRVCFEGTELEYVYTKAFNRGVAEVMLDGEPHRVDLFDPRVGWQSRTVFGGMKPGRHCALIRVLGERSPGSSGNFIDVDAFVVR